MATASVDTKKGYVSANQSRTFPVLFDVRGLLTNYSWFYVESADRWVHNLTLHRPSSRTWFHCSYWADSKVDLSPILEEEVTFHVTAMRPGRQKDDGTQYGTYVGRELPRVIFDGYIDVHLEREYTVSE